MSWTEVLEILGYLFGAWVLGLTGGWFFRILKRAVDATH